MKLIPPDLKRCQCEWIGGSFMTFGPRPTIRCDFKPTVIVTERNPDDGVRGSMSLCDKHLQNLIEQKGSSFFTMKSIKRSRQ
jgi:hypothetical protein